MEKKERLKCLFLPTWYPSNENRVAGVFVREHAQAVSLYNDVTVFYNEGAEKDVNGLYKLVSDKTEYGIRTIRITHRKSPMPKTSYFCYLWSIWREFRKLIEGGWRPDIIHAHVYSAGVPGVFLGKIYKIPVVITEHWSGFPRHILCKFDIFMARFAMNRAQIILPVSKDLEEAIKSYSIKNRFEVVPNVVNTNIFFPSVVKRRNYKKRILFVALLSPAKGIPCLLQALAHLSKKRQDFLLDIVGDGPNRKEYEDLTERLGLRTFLFFHGLKPKKEVAEFMRSNDFFVLPSLWENLPCVLLEAMASGLPIIATEVGGIPDIINEDKGILVPPKNINALAEAIDYMLDHYQDYSPNNISQYAKNKFSYEVVGAQLTEVYRTIRNL